MLGSLLEKKLKEIKGGTLLVVMDDGIAFKGRLKDYDKSTLVLEEIYQTFTDTIAWQDIDLERDDDVNDENYGYVHWTSINLKEVYLNVEHISRIWPRELIKDKYKGGSEQREPIYYRQRTDANLSLGMDVSAGKF